MGQIKQLPEDIAIKIAAGEVVERPSSVVKELVENSLDAGATHIDVSIEQGGKTRIEIRDNGCGMDKEDAVKAFLRHGTSKIRDVDDLLHVTTLGFRGEALAAISASATVVLETAEQESATGTRVTAENAAITSVKPHAPVPGTAIMVTDLFSAIPARQKFLKSEATEWKTTLEILVKQIIAHPEVGFSVKHNGRSVFNLPAEQSFTQRVGELWKIDPDQFIDVIIEVPHMKLYGVIAKPETAHISKPRQFLSVNGHPVNDKLLARSIRDAFGTLLPPGLQPVYALTLTIHPGMVDVNIHPRKDEVRFVNPQEVFRFVLHAVSQSLSGLELAFGKIGESASFFSPPSPVLESEKRQPEAEGDLRERGTGETPLLVPPFSPSPLRVPPTEWGSRGEEALTPPRGQSFSSPKRNASFNHVPIRSILEVPQLDTSLPHPILVLDCCYLITRYVDQLLIVDQHAAHERILYHKFWREDEEKSITRQALLIPASLELSAEEQAVFDERRSDFESIGFSFDSHEGILVMKEVPYLMKRGEPSVFFHQLLKGLGEERREPELKDFKHKLFATMACKAAVKAGDTISEQEKRHLIDELMTLSDRFTCPHGRPSYILIGSEGLEKLFKRTGF